LTVAFPEPTRIAKPIARVTFVAGGSGEWRVREMRTIRGQPLADAKAVGRIEGESFVSGDAATWLLHGVRSHERYLPAIARRLYHCRELGEPFDFLTWFELSEADEAAFDELVARLRETEEWRYVEREIEIRLVT
jgi:hemolysin-activating ACP:hemolysin acyltransferase